MDSATLRATLLKTDNTLPSIQRSAAGMMTHYDRIPSIAVDDWRQCLASCHTDQLLPLLYVANEVIQTSKRNRGNKYLEAFSPVLGSSLRLACSRDRSIVEKIRRTGTFPSYLKAFVTRPWPLFLLLTIISTLILCGYQSSKNKMKNYTNCFIMMCY